jgi:hypothetical protein
MEQVYCAVQLITFQDKGVVYNEEHSIKRGILKNDGGPAHCAPSHWCRKSAKVNSWHFCIICTQKDGIYLGKLYIRAKHGRPKEFSLVNNPPCHIKQCNMLTTFLTSSFLFFQIMLKMILLMAWMHFWRTQKTSKCHSRDKLLERWLRGLFIEQKTCS